LERIQHLWNEVEKKSIASLVLDAFNSPDLSGLSELWGASSYFVSCLKPLLQSEASWSNFTDPQIGMIFRMAYQQQPSFMREILDFWFEKKTIELPILIPFARQTIRLPEKQSLLPYKEP